jgi:hypothetical protein
MRKRAFPGMLPCALLYTGLAVVMTYPLAWHMGVATIGASGDKWEFIWDLWWVKRALLVEHTNPYWTGMLFYPNQFCLGRHALVMGLSLASIPLQVLWSPEVAYNLLVLGGIVANGLAANYLAFQALQDRRAAFLAGLIFAFSPVFVPRVLFHLNCLHVWVVPLAMAFFMRWIRERRWLHAFLSAGSLALSVIINEYFSIFIVCAWGVLLVYWWTGRQVRLASLIGRTAIVVCLALVLLAPDLYLRRAAFTEPDQVAGWARPLSADLLSFVTPGWFHPVFGSIVTRLTGGKGGWFDEAGYLGESVTFVGYTVIALAFYGFKKLDRTTRRPWLWLAVSFAVMSLGPVLHIAGRYDWNPDELGLGWLARLLAPVYDLLGVRNRNLGIPLPYFLFSKIPYLNAARAANRWVTVTVLAASILAAQGAVSLSRSVQARLAGRAPWAEWAIYGLVAGLVLFESLACPYPISPNGLPAVYSTIVSDPTNFAIFELPANQRAAGDDMYYQTLHGRPLLYAQVSRGHASASSFLEQEPFLSLLTHPERIGDPTQVFPLGQLREKQVKYVIVNEAQLIEHIETWGGAAAAVYRLLETNLTELPSGQPGTRLFRVYD